MTVEQMKQKKQQLGYSCEQLSELSGISLESFKIFLAAMRRNGVWMYFNSWKRYLRRM